MIIYFIIYFLIFLIIFSFFSSFLFNSKILFFFQKNTKFIGKIKNNKILQKKYNYYLINNLINKKLNKYLKSKKFIKKVIWNSLIKEKLLNKEINLGIEITNSIKKNIINKKYKKYYKNNFFNIFYEIIINKKLLNKEKFDIIKYGLFNNKNIIENYNLFYEKNNFVDFYYIYLPYNKEKKFFLQKWFLNKKIKKIKMNIIKIINYYSKEDEDKIKKYLNIIIPFFYKNKIKKYNKNKKENNLLSQLDNDFFYINNFSKIKKIKKGLIIGPNKYKNFLFLIKIKNILLLPKNIKIKKIFFKKNLKNIAKKIFFKIKKNQYKFDDYLNFYSKKKEKKEKINFNKNIYYKIFKKKIGSIFFLKTLKGYNIIKLIDKNKKYKNFVKISIIFKKIIPSTKTLHKVQKEILNYDINKILKKYQNQNVYLEIKNNKIPIIPFKIIKKYKDKIKKWIFSKKRKIGDKKMFFFNNSKQKENKEIILLSLKDIKNYNNIKIITQWNRKLNEIKNFYKKKIIQSNNDIKKLSKILNKPIKFGKKKLKDNDELTATAFGIPFKKLSNPVKYKNNFIILKIKKKYNKYNKNINNKNKIKLYFSEQDFLNFLIKKNKNDIIFYKNKK